MSEPLRLLVADRALDWAQMMAEFVRCGATRADAEVRIAVSYDEALEAFRVQQFDVALVGDPLGAGDGPSLLREIRRRGILTPFIVFTNGGAGDVAAEATNAGAADHLSKANLTADVLQRTIRHALALHAEERQRRRAEAALRASDDRVRSLEAQLRQTQRLEAVGQLVGGVAHDFNNLLTAILGYCDLVLDQMPNEDPLRQDVLAIQSAGDRAASLTRQLFAFSPRQPQQPQVVEINTVVARLEKLLRRLISEDLELVTTLAPGLRPVTIDPAAVEQVLLNLAVNARDAMPPGGRLTIETANVEIDDTGAATGVTMAPGPYVMLAIGDTGQGMDAATRARELARGGLGLATVSDIVKQSGGHIVIDSEPRHGTVCRVYLPATGPAPAASDGEAAPGWETVLLVEDEDAVRALARDVLRRCGYVVLDARDGVDALRVAEQYRGDIHLLVTDIVMPRMSGRELADRLATVRPTMKVVCMSGYADHVLMHRELAAGTVVLQKPFTPSAFARQVRSVLDAETP